VIRIQSVYDVVAGRSLLDRFAPTAIEERAPGKSRRPPLLLDTAPPEDVLGYRWRGQTGKKRASDVDDDEEDIKLMQAGLIVPSERNAALPDSV
jgi:hypothetical protein